MNSIILAYLLNSQVKMLSVLEWFGRDPSGKFHYQVKISREQMYIFQAYTDDHQSSKAYVMWL